TRNCGYSSRMYIPRFNRIDDREQIVRFIQEHGFGTLVSNGNEGMIASHLPVLWSEPGEAGWGTLRSHMARANPQWRHFESGEEILVVFHGPHAYISPSWYVMQHTVPTWNYAVVHAYGVPELLDEPGLRQVVEDTTAQYEANMAQPW